MDHQLVVPTADHQLQPASTNLVPALFADADEHAAYRFIEFFTAEIENDNTRAAYARAVMRFSFWCQQQGVKLEEIHPVLVAAYIKELRQQASKPTVKQHLSAINKLFDYLVVGQVVPFNPAASVRGPKYKIKKGKTPILTSDEARTLLDSIDTQKLAGLRDRALIGVMVFSFARVGAVVGMDVQDYLQKGKRSWFRLHEKGGKYHEVPAHHNAEEYVDAYLHAAGITDDKKGPLFRSLGRRRKLTQRRIDRREVWSMIKRRARRAGLSEKTCCHTFRGTGLTTYLENGGTLEHAQQIAAHESPRTTKLYDRTSDRISLDEIERIVI